MARKVSAERHHAKAQRRQWIQNFASSHLCMRFIRGVMALPIHPPFAPMEALSVEAIPEGGEWQYEPKWDGFRCVAFRDGNEVELQSKAGQPLARYFPEIVEAVRALKPKQFVLDGELVIVTGEKLS